MMTVEGGEGTGTASGGPKKRQWLTSGFRRVRKSRKDNKYMLYHDRVVFGTLIKEVDKFNVTTASIISLSNRSIIPWKTNVENPIHSIGIRKMTSCGLPGFTCGNACLQVGSALGNNVHTVVCTMSYVGYSSDSI